MSAERVKEFRKEKLKYVRRTYEALKIMEIRISINGEKDRKLKAKNIWNMFEIIYGNGDVKDRLKRYFKYAGIFGETRLEE